MSQIQLKCNMSLLPNSGFFKLEVVHQHEMDAYVSDIINNEYFFSSLSFYN